MSRRGGGFGDPYEVDVPPGAQGWRDAYPYYLLFLEHHRARDAGRTWFRSSMHFPEPMTPFDVTVAERALASTGAMNARVFAVPPSLGIEVRVVNGYVYMATNEVGDAAEVARRAVEFAERAGWYYLHWDDLYARWEVAVRERIAALDAITFAPLPDLEPAQRLRTDPGTTSAHDLLVSWHALLASLDATWDLHSELLNLGYAAYLNLLLLCRNTFPEVTDQQVARMVTGIEILLLRPDAELRRLARLAVDLDVDHLLPAGLAAFEAGEPGRRFLAAWQEAADPWFHYSNGSGFYHHHRSWSDDPTFPLAALTAYAARLRVGEDITPPDPSQDRDAVVAAFAGQLDPAEREQFDAALALCRTVFPYVENHNFSIEHWYMTRFWAKMREVGGLLVDAELLAAVDDVFFLRRSEIGDALADLALAWCGGGTPAGRGYWAPVILRRRQIHAALAAWPAPRALGPAPAPITDPMTIMLWGITDERVDDWLDDHPSAGVLAGIAASAGVAEGPARVVLDPAGLDALCDGEVLVAPVTSPSWTPVFGRIVAAVSDIGGIMCHAAIVSREYGLPAVVGTGRATTTIRTGQRVRVDGGRGTVTVLEP